MDGLVCGRYRTQSKLGEGGMAEVWLARHELIDQQAAIKLLQPHMSINQEMVRRFLKEAQAAAAIKHPGIVEIYDVGYAHDGRAYIVMELLRGEPLNDRLRREKRLSIDQTVRLMRQLAGVMDAAHQKQIFHRDLKPENLFVVPDPEVQGGERIKVLDFGLAKLATEFAGSLITSQGAVFGTPAYMAPEQCKDSGQVDWRADLYSMGCIFYRCLCGRPPFDYRQPLALMTAQLRTVPKPPRERRGDIPASLDALIMRLLAKEPDERVQTCAELIDALDADPALGSSMKDDAVDTLVFHDGDKRQASQDEEFTTDPDDPLAHADTDTHGHHGHDASQVDAVTLIPSDPASDGIPVAIPTAAEMRVETERVAVPTGLLDRSPGQAHPAEQGHATMDLGPRAPLQPASPMSPPHGALSRAGTGGDPFTPHGALPRAGTGGHTGNVPHPAHLRHGTHHGPSRGPAWFWVFMALAVLSVSAAWALSQ